MTLAKMAEHLKDLYFHLPITKVTVDARRELILVDLDPSLNSQPRFVQELYDMIRLQADPHPVEFQFRVAGRTLRPTR